MPEVVLMDSWDAASLNLSYQEKEVIVDIACGIAVLRGAHVFAPGIKGMSRGICKIWECYLILDFCVNTNVNCFQILLLEITLVCLLMLKINVLVD